MTALCLAVVTLAAGQSIPETLKQRNEVCFSFQVKSRQEINDLTSLISIDKVDGNTVTAYANMAEYLKFMKLGYEITLLPVPGFGEGVEMAGHVLLSPLTTWNFYPAYPAYESIMAQFQAMYPAICHLDTIATLASGRRLLVLKISDNVNVNEAEPEFLYTSSIHGDETTGYILMLHLADYLLSNYGTNTEVTDLVNNLEIYICPLANPDGTYYGGNSTVTGARRYNANSVDLNRNYPDPKVGAHPDGNAWQPETVAFMDFATQHHFVAGTNFHGGEEVVNYPWDTWATLNADDDFYQFISREYADTVHLHAPSTYMTFMNNGVTNGYAWYEVNGGRQDYMNYFQHCREITIEISNTKILPATQLTAHWDYNWRSFILWMKEARYGVQGLVTSQATGLPVAAKVYISGHDNNNSEVYSSSDVGDYHRLLKAGTYSLEFSAPCYQTQVISNVVVTDHHTTSLNVQLVPGAGVTTTAVSAITATTATSGGTATCDGGSAITARGVCWGTAANPVVTGPHTTDGTGTGTFTSQITGLSPNTTYHVRAYVTNAGGTIYGSDVQFASGCGTIAVFPYYEGFENSGSIPNCWTQQQVSSSGINWTFITGSGNSHPAAAHGGTYNACLKDNTAADSKTKLISPALNLSLLPLPRIKFWHTQAVWSGDQDQLAVYYRTSAAGTWTLITTYTASITAWTQETLVLPSPSADYYIAFEGNAKYGYGVCVDDVEISSSCAAILPVSATATADANPVFMGTTVNFTATVTNGGTLPAYQWRVNNAAVAGATNSTYAYIPANNDQVACVASSNLACVSGNPATSSIITMTVQSVPVTTVIGNVVVSNLQTTCYNALQTITVAGNGTTFAIQAGGISTMIAGQNIVFLPGAQIPAGAYLYAYIAPAGPWCSQQDNSDIISGSERGKISADDPDGLFRLYPNPASGNVILEYNNPGNQGGEILVEAFNMTGDKILSANGFIEHRKIFSLKEYPAGVYLFRISYGRGTRTFRVIHTAG